LAKKYCCELEPHDGLVDDPGHVTSQDGKPSLPGPPTFATSRQAAVEKLALMGAERIAWQLVDWFCTSCVATMLSGGVEPNSVTVKVWPLLVLALGL